MNLLSLKYAVEVAACGSINKAAEKLYIDQPNLSRSIRDLEASLGVTIFERSARGMKLTEDGEVFLRHAQTVLSEVDEMEKLFRRDGQQKKYFSLSAPRADYISEAFSAFSLQFAQGGEVDAYYRETNSMRTIKNLLQDECRLGIVRYAAEYDRKYKDFFESKGFLYELITEFRPVLLFGADSSLARKETVSLSDLAEKIELAYADPYVPSVPAGEIKKKELPERLRRIVLFDRSSLLELLSHNPDTFVCTSPVSEGLRRRYGLISRTLAEPPKQHRDVLLYRGDYKLTEFDRAFLTELNRAKRKIFG